MATCWGHRVLSTDKDWERGCESLAMGNPVGNLVCNIGALREFPVWDDWKQYIYYLGEVKTWRVANPELAELLLFTVKLTWYLEKRAMAIYR